MMGPRICMCGSGLWKYELRDARGIFCTYVCQICEADKRKSFRAEIFTDSEYEADEPVEAEDY